MKKIQLVAFAFIMLFSSCSILSQFGLLEPEKKENKGLLLALLALLQSSSSSSSDPGYMISIPAGVAR